MAVMDKLLGEHRLATRQDEFITKTAERLIETNIYPNKATKGVGRHIGENGFRGGGFVATAEFTRGRHGLEAVPESSAPL